MVGTCGTLTLGALTFIVSASLFSVAIAAPVTNSSCPLDHFFDHRIGTCEHCNVICDGATHRGTENDCQQLCPAYANILLNNEVKHPVAGVFTPQPAQSSPETGGSLFLAITIGTGMVVVALGLLIFHVVFKYREKIARRLRSRSSLFQSTIYQVTSQDDTDAPIIPTTSSSSACSVPRKIHVNGGWLYQYPSHDFIDPGQDPIDRDQVVPKVVPETSSRMPISVL